METTTTSLIKAITVGILGMTGYIAVTVSPLMGISLSKLFLLTTLIIPAYSIYSFCREEVKWFL